MTPEPNNKKPSPLLYAFLGLAVIAVILLAMLNLDELKGAAMTFVNALKPLLYGIFIAYLVNPLMVFFEEKIFRFKSTRFLRLLRRGLSVTVSMLIAASIVIFFCWFFVNNVYDSLLKLVDQGKAFLQSPDSFIRQINEGRVFGISISKLLGIVGIELTADLNALYESIANPVSKIFPAIIPTITGLVTNVIKEMLNLLVGIILSVYFLCFKERTLAQIRKCLTAILKKETLNEFYRVSQITDDNIGGFIRGKILDSLIIGILTYFVTMLFKIPYYPVISVIVGVTNFIPFFGPFIGAIPSAFIVLMVEPQKVIWFLLMILIIQQLDGNVIGPFILSGHVRLSALWVSVAIIVMGGLFGFVGMLIGVPVFGVLFTLIGEQIDRKLTEKGMTTDTMAYVRETSGVRKRPRSSLVQPKKPRKRKQPKEPVEKPKEE